MGLTNLAATSVPKSETMVEEQDERASAGPATDNDVTLDVLAAVEELVPTCGSAPRGERSVAPKPRDLVLHTIRGSLHKVQFVSEGNTSSSSSLAPNRGLFGDGNFS